MDIVALVALGTPVEVEAPLLAADLGAIAYETALLLRTPPPVVLLRTPDRARALDLLTRLRSRRHDVIACEESAVATGNALTHVRSFRFDADAFHVTSVVNREDRVAWGDVVALVRAVHRSSGEEIKKTEEKKFSIRSAVVTGGLVNTKKVTKETTQTTESREQVLYVFRRNGAPFLLAQTRALYTGLGPELRPSQIENFATILRLLRERAPSAPYDERLIGPRPGHDRVRPGTVAGSIASSSSDGIDLLAHLTAQSLARRV